MLVLKFGGTSLGDAASTRAAARIAAAAHRRERIVTVVSAMAGVTDDLTAAARMSAEGRGREARDILRRLQRRHRAPRMPEAFERIGRLLDGIESLGECSPRSLDAVIGWGEVLQSRRFAAALAGLRAVPVDARELVRTDDRFGDAGVDREITRANLRRALGRLGRRCVPVVTGFIGATADGRATTLGRGGSDYTAALVGAALDAREIQIWTDVDGIMSADPRRVPEAFALPRVSYLEAMEMAYFGAKVIYSKTMLPAMERSIPIRIKNTTRPEAPGTLIAGAADPEAGTIRCVTSREELVLLNLEGGGMAGVPGIASRLFTAMARERVNVIVISQASSEQSICLVVEERDAAAARRAVETEFAADLAARRIARLDVRPDVAVVAVVGDRMRGVPGIAGRLFGVLGRNRINILAIAQGSSERNISLVVERRDVRRALNVVHGVFRLSVRTVNVVLLGVGVVGSAVLRQIERQRGAFERDLGLRLRVVGLAGRRRRIFDPAGVRIERLKRSRAPTDLDALLAPLRELENPVVVDATGAPEVARRYADLLRRGFSVVTPGKLANTAPMRSYRELMAAARRRHSYYAYETTVGAGLPVISTLHNLIRCGDAIVEIQGILSGTLSFLFSEAAAGRPFAEAMREAQRRGYTEPDPRDDLSGRDFARKMLILAREIGLELELADVAVERLDLSRLDRRLSEARRCGRALRYVGRIAGGRCRVGLTELEPDSPMAQIRGTDNIVMFRTRHYDPWPLVVRGPGAGAEVTAGGILADLLKISNLLAQA